MLPARCSAPLLLLIASLGTACGDDATSSDAALDTGTADTSTPADSSAPTDTSTPTDTGTATDTSVTTDGSVCGCLESGFVSWNYSGGRRAFDRYSIVTACRDYTLEHYEPPPIDGSPDAECTIELGCSGAASFGALMAALAHPDVVAAFEAAPVIYGLDSRPSDGVVLQVSYDGTIEIGDPCGGAAGCTPIPPGVQTLRTFLEGFQDELRSQEPCATAIPGT